MADTGQRVRVCDECEAAWPETGALDPTAMLDVSVYGVHEDWSVLSLQEG